MSITTPATIQVTKQSELYVPPISAEPLQTALENLNYLWKWHRPPLVDVCPSRDWTSDRGFVGYIPIRPSADALNYTFVTKLMPAATSTATVTIDYCTTYAGVGGTTWTNIVTTAGIATTANTSLTHTDANYAIPANAVCLRLEVAAAGINHIRCDHFLVYPSPGSAAAGIQAGSGFVPFDDGILAAAGSPIHTEFLNRCKLSTVAVTRDRWQMAFSFVQQAESNVATPCASSTNWTALPPVRVYLPKQTSGHLYFHAIGTVDAGATADLIRIRQIGVSGGLAATFNADDTLDGNGFDVYPQRSAEWGAYVDLEVACKNTVGNTTSLRSLVGFWRPNDDSTKAAKPITAEVAPAAAVALLTTAVNWPLKAATLPYCGCGKLFDQQNTFEIGHTRYLSIMVAPGAKHLRMGIARGFDYTDGFIGGSAPALLATSQGGYGGSDIVTHKINPTPTVWWRFWFAFGNPHNIISETAATVDDAPAATMDRQFEVATNGYPYVEEARCNKICGLSTFLSDQTDLETL